MNRIKHAAQRLLDIFMLPQKVDQLQRAVGRVELRQTEGIDALLDIRAHEFKVYSQWGEDGILQYLMRQTHTGPSTFVEFGVQDYRESNTRFLLQHNNWDGLVIDGDPQHIDFIKSDPLNYRYSLKAACAFIDRDNINDLILQNGIAGEIGLLSVDVDGNDYWIWQAITCIQPRIVVCEYNSLFGSHARVSVPYASDFVRERVHYSFLYYGASIAALHTLAGQKGYTLVGGNSAGNNAFFVRNDVLGGLPECTPIGAYMRAKFRESRDMQGNHTFLDFDESRKLIAELPIHDVQTGQLFKVADLLP